LTLTFATVLHVRYPAWALPVYLVVVIWC